MDALIWIIRMNSGMPGGAFENVTIKYSTVKEFTEF
jgi:hypothetical protein